jgi:hypothetical protein
MASAAGRLTFCRLPSSSRLDDHVRSWLDGKLRQRRAAEIERARVLL